MTITITLPDGLAAKLQAKAQIQQLQPEELILDILSSAVELEFEQDVYPTPDEVIARIKATRPNQANIRPASGSLLKALQNSPHDPEFDLEAWNKEWAAIETEMKAITRANDIAEGRG